METYPKIKTVEPLSGKRLKVTFANDVIKIYDCNSLLDKPAFYLLRDDAVFNAVHSDTGGYGVVWNDDIDLAESELWLNGMEFSHSETIT